MLQNVKQNMLEKESGENTIRTIRRRCQNSGTLDRKRKTRKRNRDSVFLFDRQHSPHKCSRRWSIVHESRGRRQYNPDKRVHSSSEFYDSMEEMASNYTYGRKDNNSSRGLRPYNSFLRSLHHDRMNREQFRNVNDDQVMCEDVPMRSRTPEANRFLRVLHQEKLCRNSPRSSLIVPSFVLHMSPNHSSSQDKRSLVPTQHRGSNFFSDRSSSASSNIIGNTGNGGNDSNSGKSRSSGKSSSSSSSCCCSYSHQTNNTSGARVGNPVEMMGKFEQKEEIRPQQLSLKWSEKKQKPSSANLSSTSLPSFRWFSTGCGKRNRNEIESTDIASSGKRMRLLSLFG